MTNIRTAQELIASLGAFGVNDFCFCTGARNAPLIQVLEDSRQIWIKNFFDERSAAFFALGMAKRSGRPVAVITTSGTAAAELLPAAIEAHYSGVPLVLITADRPRGFRGSAAPQAIEQVGLFSHYTKRFYDIDALTDSVDDVQVAPDGVTHINICFSEPLLDFSPFDFSLSRTDGLESRALESGALKSDTRMKKPLVIVGGLNPAWRGRTLEFLLSLGAPVYIEAPSGLREDARLNHLKLRSGKAGLMAKNFAKYFDGVLRIGSVPTLRLWRDLDLDLKHVPVLSVCDLPFSGLAREKSQALSFATFFSSPRSYMSGETSHELQENAREVLSEDLHHAEEFEKLLCRWNDSEVALIRNLSEAIPSSAMVFLGNSLPIREWDLAASWEISHPDVAVNRGANGIDGLISTFLGVVATGSTNENWLILGDLSALYDLNALATAETEKLATAEADKKIRIVVINNKGGQIFASMLLTNRSNDRPNERFLNSHSFGFSHWAEMFNFEYLRCDGQIDLDKIHSLGSRAVIEVIPDNKHSAEFSRTWNATNNGPYK